VAASVGLAVDLEAAVVDCASDALFFSFVVELAAEVVDLCFFSFQQSD